MGFTLSTDEKVIKALEKFVCKIYSYPRLDSVNHLRLEIFLKQYKPKNKGSLVDCVKKFDGSALPPCLRVLTEKIKRTNFVAGKCLSAWTKSPPMVSPANCGWKLVDGKFSIKWFIGNVAPQSIDVISSECSEDEEDYNSDSDDDLQTRNLDYDSTDSESDDD